MTQHNNVKERTLLDFEIYWTKAERYWTAFKHEKLKKSAIVYELTSPNGVRRIEKTLAEYLALPKDEKHNIKSESSCWLGSEAITPGFHKRSQTNIKNKTLLILDVDDTGESASELQHKLHALFGAYEYLIFPSISSEEYNASVRLVFFLARPVDTYTYQAAARYIGQQIEEAMPGSFDWTSTESERLYYEPTLCKDVEHWAVHNQPAAKTDVTDLLDFEDTEDNNALFEIPEYDEYAPLLDPLLVLHDKGNWRESDTLPRGITDDGPKAIGIVTADARVFNSLEGAVCRNMPIDVAMELSGAWEKHSEGQWTLAGGTGAAGGKTFIDDDGKESAYSHHNSDPYSGRSLNSFEVICCYKFGADSRHPKSHLDAFAAAREFFLAMPEIAADYESTQAEYVSNLTTGFTKKDSPVTAAREMLEITSSDVEHLESLDDLFADDFSVKDGGSDPKKPKAVAPIDLPVNCDEMLERYWFVQGAGGMASGLSVFDTKRKAVVPIPTGTHAQHFHIGMNVSGKQVEIFELDLWKAHRDRITIQEVNWHPGKKMLYRDDTGLLAANTYRAVEHSAAGHNSDHVKLMIEHIDFLFPDEKHRLWFWQYLGFIVQNPGVRVGIAPLLIAPKQGTGRGAMLQMLQRVFGSHNVKRPTIDTIVEDKNNGHLFNCLLTVVDEVYAKESRFSIQEKLNAQITETRIQYSEKYEVSRDRDCFTNFILLSNRLDALPLTEADRRIQVLLNPEEHKSSEYYVNLYAAIDGAGSENLAKANASALYDHLVNVDLTGFDRTRAWVDDAAKKTMYATSHSNVTEVLNELRKAMPCRVMTYAQIKNWCNEYADRDEFSFNPNALEKVVRRSSEHVRKVEGRVRVNGSQGNMQQLYLIDTKAKMTPAEMRKEATEYARNLKAAGGHSSVGWSDEKKEGLKTKEKPPSLH